MIICKGGTQYEISHKQLKYYLKQNSGFPEWGGTNSIHNFQMVKLAATLCHDSQQA